MSSRSLGAFFSRGLTPTGGAFIFGQALVQGLNVQQCYTLVKFGIYWSMLVARMSLVILWPRLNGNLIFLCLANRRRRGLFKCYIIFVDFECPFGL